MHLTSYLFKAMWISLSSPSLLRAIPIQRKKRGSWDYLLHQHVSCRTGSSDNSESEVTSGNGITGSESVHAGGAVETRWHSPTETIQTLLLGGHFFQTPQGLSEVRSAQAISFTRLFASPDQPLQYIKSSLPLA